MQLEDIELLIYNLKKRVGKIKTNYISGDVKKGTVEEIKDCEDGLWFVVAEPFRKRGFFAVKNDVQAIRNILGDIPKECIIQYAYRENNDMQELFSEALYRKYATYVRVTTIYKESLFSIPEEGRRKLLEEMYNPQLVEYADIKDSEELARIHAETFDPLCDDVYTVEEWREIIYNKECVLTKENGSIVSYYVFRIEGKKLYSNIAVNKGAANLLYNLERYVYEKAWEQGICVFYAWIDLKNSKALNRSNKRAQAVIKSTQKIYCDFWKKD